jgi:hypothetical protein
VNLYKKPKDSSRRAAEIRESMELLRRELDELRAANIRARRQAFRDLPVAKVILSTSQPPLVLNWRLVRWTKASIWLAADALVASQGGTRFVRKTGEGFRYRAMKACRADLDGIEKTISEIENAR